MPSDKASRVIFIGNIPYGLTEEQIIHIFSQVGQVLSFRLVYDKDTGRPKGYGFAEFSDADAAASAVRNLNDHDIMGRKLRVDYSNEGGGAGNDHQPPTSNTSNGLDTHAPTAQQTSSLPPLPPGVNLPPNMTCPDAISRTLSSIPADQLLDILSQMKGVVTTDPAKAQELLTRAPQLSYAIFQSLLLLNLVDTNTLASVVNQSQIPQAPPPPIPRPMQTAFPPQFPPHMQQQQHQQQPQPMQSPFQQVQPPPPPQMHQQQQQQQQQQQAQLGPDKDLLKQQVMALTQQQIDQMDPANRNSIMALRHQIMAGAV